MFEKIKDFFFDASDFLLSLIIIILIFSTIWWKLSATMHYSTNIDIPFVSSSEETEVPKVPETPKKEIEIDLDSIETESNSEVINNSVNDEITEENQNNNLEQTEPSTETETKTTTETQVAPKPEPVPEPVVVETITFIVSNGMSADRIINKLQSNGLITSKSDFTARLVERKLDGSLRSGTFTLKSDMSYDQIINVLTGR